MLDQTVLRDFCWKIEEAAENSGKRVQMGHKNEGTWEEWFFSFGWNLRRDFCSQIKFFSWGRIHHSGIWMLTEMASLPECLLIVVLPNVTEKGFSSFLVPQEREMPAPLPNYCKLPAFHGNVCWVYPVKLVYISLEPSTICCPFCTHWFNLRFPSEMWKLTALEEAKYFKASFISDLFQAEGWWPKVHGSQWNVQPTAMEQLSWNFLL